MLVCSHKTCRRQGAKASLKELRRSIKAHDLRRAVMLTKVKCLDQCGRGPVMVVYPEGVWYGGVDEAGAREIVSEQLAAGCAVNGVKILRDMRDEERQ